MPEVGLEPTCLAAEDFELSGYTGALLHNSTEGRMSPCIWTDSSYGFSDGRAERGEAVQDGDTVLELGDLTVEVPRSQTLAQAVSDNASIRRESDPPDRFLARIVFWPGSYFDAAPAVIAAPSSPDGSTEAA